MVVKKFRVAIWYVNCHASLDATPEFHFVSSGGGIGGLTAAGRIASVLVG